MDPNDDVTRQGRRNFALGPVPKPLVFGLVVVGGVQSWMEGFEIGVFLSGIVAVALVVLTFLEVRGASAEHRVRLFGATVGLFGFGLCALGLRAILESNHEVVAPIAIIVVGATGIVFGLIVVVRPR